MYHILLVDDDSDMLAIETGWLKKEYLVDTAASAAGVFSFLEHCTPDLILMDYRMPDMNGAEIVNSIRNDIKNNDIPVIFLSGAEDDIAPESMGTYGFVRKSEGRKALLSTLDLFFRSR